MAQILAPSAQWQMRVTKNSTDSSPLTSKMWSSLLVKQNKKGTVRSSAKFKVLAVKSENGTINRMKDLLNMDITPFTDKIIAEYIWYVFFGLRFSITPNSYCCSRILVHLIFRKAIR